MDRQVKSVKNSVQKRYPHAIGQIQHFVSNIGT